MASIALPQGFGHVTTAIVSSTWLLVWQTILVGRFRRRAGIDYPQLYAETAEMKASKDATLFNCAQRAHANTLETLPVVLLSTLVASLKNPYYASYACGLWVFARILYTLGYTTGDPAKRNTRGGGLGSLAMLGLLVGATYTTFDLVRSGL
ncbi:hypothetical protein SERLADRAFT_365244 [Serpula lacrymans var. lacrymans S7.9]|uniref:Membrane-associated proteins in eicosanoid and glutathione metabolism n=1 Tax=Serpula lacrymans var. lacrymans (strain S7.9) TaxID=578457 RepID=F8NHR0_SERL9|nr:uncharacterized protein SERLADRAFT_365244 [Serpula lacrymans var. lacrymans S7.9]EGO29224.1 hypothetical protein SERLADRAFT_365244 [Serpula lacrymans var. lacrymans S7.9]